MKPKGRVRIVRVNDEEGLKELFRFRYRVFCIETGIFDAANYPDGMEKDEFDHSAEHYKLVDEADTMVGAFRFIRNNPVGFPSFVHMGLTHLLGKEYDPDRIAEFSRFAVAKDFRGLRNMITLVKEILRQGCPYLKRYGIDHVFFAVEENFYRIIRMTQLPFHPVEKRIYFEKERILLCLGVEELRRKHPIFCR